MNVFTCPEPDPKPVMPNFRWVLDNPFILSLSFHEGRVLVNYPWDDSPAAVEGEKVISYFIFRKKL